MELRNTSQRLTTHQIRQMGTSRRTRLTSELDKRPTGRGRRRGLILTFTRRHAEVNNVDPHAECLYESVRLGVKDVVADE